MHDYEACDRVCPVLGGRRTDPVVDPAEHFRGSDQHHTVHIGRLQFVLLLSGKLSGKL